MTMHDGTGTGTRGETVFMVNLLANKQKHRRPSVISAAHKAAQEEEEENDVVDPASDVRGILTRHAEVAVANGIVMQHCAAYGDFLDKWLQEGMSRFILNQKSKRN